MNTNHSFISYGRADSKEFATKLCAALTEKGFDVWFDQDDIPLAVDFQEQINDGIAKADNFLFIIAPHSVNSPYCLKEIELALQYHKRIIPVLHVEHITKETWQGRNPTGTEEDWSIYQEKGLHSSFPNMQPDIGKINWIYCREGLDAFEKSLAGLVTTFQKHERYVQQHTQFLNQALAWEEQQKQSRYLLTGEDRAIAEQWLNIRFNEEQPPCTPSDLHCEFIIESIKNANNLMTQVFVAYADTDRSIMEKIRQSLYREGFTVWTSQTDVKTGESFERSIFRGIEQADNFVYLLSPDANISDYCQKEIEYALSLNKRIIPLLIRATTLENLHPQLQTLQYIDLTNQIANEEWLDQSKLIKILRHDAAYYAEHKILLAKALKWERQSKNPSILLRGYNLRSAETWWKVAQKREQHLPTQIQEQFLEASLQQPPVNSLDVFISYSRADSDFARQLHDALQLQGKTTWFDQESIATGSDFQQEIYRGIESSDNFLFVISPRAVTSPYCAGEVEYAAQLGKRFVTLLYRAVESDGLHPELAKVQWINFSQTTGDFSDSFNQLVRTLDTDRAHVHQHTKWSQRALEWKAQDYSKDLLLRGSEFAIAQEWWQEAIAQEKTPPATKIQGEFIHQSQVAIDAAKKREQSLFRLLIVLLVGVSVALLGVFHLYRKSAQQTKVANFRADSYEIERLMETNPVNSLVLAIATLGKSQGQRGIQRELHSVQQNLHLLVDRVRERSKFQIQSNGEEEGHFVLSVAFSPDGQIIASGHEDGSIRLWDLQGNPIGKPFIGHTDRVYSVAFSPDGKRIISGSLDKTLRRWDLDGNPIGPPFLGHTDLVSSVAFSPDGKKIVSGSRDGTVLLWSWQGHTLGSPLIGHTDWVRAVSFSPDGQSIVSGSKDGAVRLWDLDGNLIGNPFTDHDSGVVSVAFSPDGQSIVSGGDDHTIRQSDLSGKAIKSPFMGHTHSVLSVTYNDDGQLIASGSADGTIRLWTRQGEALDIQLIGHTDWVRSIAFSPNSQSLVSSGDDGTIRLWDISNEQSTHQSFVSYGDPVRAVAVSPEAMDDNRLPLVVSGGQGGTIALWDLEGTPMKQPFKAHTSWINILAFSPDGQMIASGSGDRTIRLWDLEGRPVAEPFRGHTSWIEAIAFSPDGKVMASGDGDGTIRLWDLDGNPMGPPLTDHRDGVTSIMFSEDSKRFVSGSKDRTVRLWTAEGEPMGQPFNGHEDEVLSVAFVSNGSRETIVSGSKDKTIRQWDMAGKPIGQPFVGHKLSVTSVAFNPDSKMIVSGSEDHTIRLWDVNGNALSQALTGHAGAVKSIAFSPDGTKIVSGSNDTTVRLWSQVTWQSWLRQGCKQLRLHPTLLNLSPESVSESKHTLNAKVAVDTCLQAQAWSEAETAEFLMQQGRSLARVDGDIAGAKKKFNQAQALLPSMDMESLVAIAKQEAALAKIRLGKGLAVNQKMRQAIAFYQTALNLDPTADLHPETLKLDQDPHTVVPEVIALFHISDGEEFARQKKIKAAIASYERAQQWVPGIDLNPHTSVREQDPETVAKQIAVMRYIKKGNKYAVQNKNEKAIEQYEQAQAILPDVDLNPKTIQLDQDPSVVVQQIQSSIEAHNRLQQGERLAISGNIEAAQNAYREAARIAPALEISEWRWNRLCWYGALHQQTRIVMQACDQAVELDPTNIYFRGSRGLARAIAGDADGAIRDLRYYIKYSQDEVWNAQVQGWIDALKRGENPVTEEDLDRLMQE